jgi:hypothetical protein
MEAVTVWTALIAAAELSGAKVILVADGPGNLGTQTRWGVSALLAGNSMNAAGVLGGRPIAALRISFADRRQRHRGVSHHSLTILQKVCHVSTHVAVPELEGDRRDAVWRALLDAGLEQRHQLVEVNGRPGLDLLERSGVDVESMGRGPADDPAFFLSAAAAGVLAGRMASGSARWASPSSTDASPPGDTPR